MNWHLFITGCCYMLGACGMGLILRRAWNIADAAFHLVALSAILAWWAA